MYESIIRTVPRIGAHHVVLSVVPQLVPYVNTTAL